MKIDVFRSAWICRNRQAGKHVLCTRCVAREKDARRQKSRTCRYARSLCNRRDDMLCQPCHPLARFFLGGDKKYEALLHLGIETDTQDATGQMISEAPVPDCSEAEIQAVFSSFTGPLDQVPPVYSALKHKGVPLYKHARRGKPIQKPARQIVVLALKITEIQLPYIRFEVDLLCRNLYSNAWRRHRQGPGLRWPFKSIETHPKFRIFHCRCNDTGSV